MSAVGDDVVLKTQLYSRPISGMTAKFAAHARLFSPANPLQCLFPEHRTESNYSTPKEWFSVPLSTIEAAVRLLISGEIVNYLYDAASETVKLVE